MGFRSQMAAPVSQPTGMTTIVPIPIITLDIIPTVLISGGVDTGGTITINIGVSIGQVVITKAMTIGTDETTNVTIMVNIIETTIDVVTMDTNGDARLIAMAVGQGD